MPSMSAAGSCTRPGAENLSPLQMDILNKAFRDTKTTALTLGITTVVATHVMMVMMPADNTTGRSPPMSHAVLNLVAAGAIVYGSRLLE